MKRELEDNLARRYIFMKNVDVRTGERLDEGVIVALIRLT